jgi:hypothetical protein
MVCEAILLAPSKRIRTTMTESMAMVINDLSRPVARILDADRIMVQFLLKIYILQGALYTAIVKKMTTGLRIVVRTQGIMLVSMRHMAYSTTIRTDRRIVPGSCDQHFLHPQVLPYPDLVRPVSPHQARWSFQDDRVLHAVLRYA